MGSCKHDDHLGIIFNDTPKFVFYFYLASVYMVEWPLQITNNNKPQLPMALTLQTVYYRHKVIVIGECNTSVA